MAEFSLKLSVLVLSLLAVAFVSESDAGTQALTQEKMDRVVRQYILENGPWKAKNIQVRVMPFQPVSLPSGTVGYRILKPSKGITPGL